ncbi:hypothetical protein AB6A40_008040 [Gnathostoma spinigerum]|uniref:Secreted protein n=1 Tax=Gnathostoma spinigerum TaxID=75299 RepID=A0ABD6EPX0_9BILA
MFFLLNGALVSLVVQIGQIILVHSLQLLENDWQFANEHNARRNSGGFQSRIAGFINDRLFEESDSKRSSPLMTDHSLWPNGTIPYKFDTSFCRQFCSF